MHNYFASDEERAIVTHYSGRIDALKMACESINGYQPNLQVL